jgi:hypothetical protein
MGVEPEEDTPGEDLGVDSVGPGVAEPGETATDCTGSEGTIGLSDDMDTNGSRSSDEPPVAFTAEFMMEKDGSDRMQRNQLQ